MALVGIELETLVSEPDALTTRPPPCVVPLGKTLNANIPTSGGAAQWMRAQAGNRKVVDSRLGQGSMSLCPWKNHFTLILPYWGQAIYPSCWPGLTKYCMTYHASCWCGIDRRSILV